MVITVDRQSYKELMNKQKPMNKFKINITEMTTTFPCYNRELKGYLMNNKGRSYRVKRWSEVYSK